MLINNPSHRKLSSLCGLVVLAAIVSGSSTLSGQNPPPDQRDQVQAQNEKVKAENEKIKALNEKLLAAAAASKADDPDTAIRILTEAKQMDATRDLIWFKLGDAYRDSALKPAHSAERNRRLTTAIADYEIAINIKKAAMEKSSSAITPQDGHALAAYYNQLGGAYAKIKNMERAKSAFAQAIQLDPPEAGTYYYNLGAVLVAEDQYSPALTAFSKVPANSALFNKAQDHIERISNSPSVKPLEPYLRNPAFQSTVRTLIQSANNQFRDIRGKEISTVDGITIWKSTVSPPGADWCRIAAGGKDRPFVSCLFAESYGFDELNAEYKQLVAAVKLIMPDWTGKEVMESTPGAVPEYQTGGSGIDFVVIIVEPPGGYTLSIMLTSYAK